MVDDFLKAVEPLKGSKLLRLVDPPLAVDDGEPSRKCVELIAQRHLNIAGQLRRLSGRAAG